MYRKILPQAVARYSFSQDVSEYVKDRIEHLAYDLRQIASGFR